MKLITDWPLPYEGIVITYQFYDLLLEISRKRARTGSSLRVCDHNIASMHFKEFLHEEYNRPGIKKVFQKLKDILEFGFASWAVADVILDMLQTKTYWEFSVQERSSV